MSPSHQRPRPGDPVDHFLVHRDAQRRGKPVVPLERRHRPGVPHPALGEARRGPPSSRPAPPVPAAPPARRPPARWPPASARVPPATCRRSRALLRHDARHRPARHLVRASASRRPAGSRRGPGRTPTSGSRLPREHPEALAHDLGRCRRRAAPAAPPHRRAGRRRPPASALAPHPAHTRRALSRRTSSSSGTTSSTTAGVPAAGQQRLERLGLGDRAGEPVEHEARRRVRPAQPLPHHLDHQRVADQLAAAHHRLHLRAPGRCPPRPPPAGCRRSTPAERRAASPAARPASPSRPPEVRAL